MIKKDYILRIVEEFARVLAAILGLRQGGQLDEALMQTDKAYRGMLDVDPVVLKSVSLDQLLDYLQNEKEFDRYYLKMIAELLFEEGMIYHELGDPVMSRNVLEKAKLLIGYLMDNDATFSFDWYEKIHEIDQVLEG